MNLGCEITKSSAGMSLLEIMIGIAISSGLIFAIGTMTLNQSRSNRDTQRINSDFDTTLLISKMIRVEKSDFCIKLGLASPRFKGHVYLPTKGAHRFTLSLVPPQILDENVKSTFTPHPIHRGPHQGERIAMSQLDFASLKYESPTSIHGDVIFQFINRTGEQRPNSYAGKVGVTFLVSADALSEKVMESVAIENCAFDTDLWRKPLDIREGMFCESENGCVSTLGNCETGKFFKGFSEDGLECAEPQMRIIPQITQVPQFPQYNEAMRALE